MMPGRSCRGLLQPNVDTGCFVFEFLEFVLLHKCQQAFDFCEIHTADAAALPWILLSWHLEVEKFSRRRGESSGAIGYYEYIVLNPYTAEFRDINTRLDSNNHSFAHYRAFV